MRPLNRMAMTGSGAVTAAFASALCCAGPLIAVALGVSGAGLANTFEPLRPYLLGGTAGLLGLGFLQLRREERNACEPGKPCAAPHIRQRMKIVLWAATALAAIFATYPAWSALLL